MARAFLYPALFQADTPRESAGWLSQLLGAEVVPDAGDVVVGLGVGGVAAWVAAGGLGAEDALKVPTLFKASLKKAPKSGGIEVLADAMPALDIETAAWMGGSQWLTAASLPRLQATLDELGGRWVWRGPPWGSAAMDPFVPGLLKRLGRLPHGPLGCIFIDVSAGKPVDNHDALPRVLAEQIARPIQWDRTLRNLRYQHDVSEVVLPVPCEALARSVLENLPGISLR